MAFHLSPSPLLASRRVFTEKGPSMWTWLIALPPLTVGMASQGFAFYLGIAISVAWLISLPLAAYLPRSATALLPPILAAVGFFTSLLTMPFNSAAFWVFSWASLGMLLMSIPKPRRDHWEEHVA